MIEFLILIVLSFFTAYVLNYTRHYLENRPSKFLKTKLLRKVRKRFQIIYNKEGHYIWNVHFEWQFYLRDNYNDFNSNVYESKDRSLEKVLEILRKEHPGKGKMNRIRSRNKKIWYGNKNNNL